VENFGHEMPNIDAQLIKTVDPHNGFIGYHFRMRWKMGIEKYNTAVNTIDMSTEFSLN
jgi:hypothetical protein